MITRVWSFVLPDDGLTEIAEGPTSTTNNVPLTTAASVARLTPMFFGPSGVDAFTVNGRAAEVGLVVDEPFVAKVGPPRSKPVFDVEKTVPAERSTPERVNVPDAPRGMRGENAVRVRF